MLPHPALACLIKTSEDFSIKRAINPWLGMDLRAPNLWVPSSSDQKTRVRPHLMKVVAEEEWGTSRSHKSLTSLRRRRRPIQVLEMRGIENQI